MSAPGYKPLPSLSWIHTLKMIFISAGPQSINARVVTWAPMSSKTYFTVHLIRQDCGTWMGIRGVMIVRRRRRSFIVAQEATNKDGQFHDIVPECSCYFSFHELLWWSHDTVLGHLGCCCHDPASEAVSFQFHQQLFLYIEL